MIRFGQKAAFMKTRFLAGLLAAAALVWCVSAADAGVLVPIPLVPESTYINAATASSAAPRTLLRSLMSQKMAVALICSPANFSTAEVAAFLSISATTMFMAARPKARAIPNPMPLAAPVMNSVIM
jgi:hypothetical protein